MKKSELKEIIRTSLLNEYGEDYEIESRKVKYNINPETFDSQLTDDPKGKYNNTEYWTSLLSDEEDEEDLDDMFGIEEAKKDKEEKTKSNKMKKPELKEMIRTAFLSEAPIEETLAMMEAEEEDVEVEVTADEKEGIDVKQDAESDLTGIVGDVQDNLEAALEAARKLGDEKLVDQVGNTLTFFTRTHVVKEEAQIDVDIDSPAEDAEIGMRLDESITRMKKLAGLK